MAATVNCQKWKIFLQKQRKPLSSTRVPVANPRIVVVAATEAEKGAPWCGARRGVRGNLRRACCGLLTGRVSSKGI
jgi:hypothetical protein